MNLALKLFLKYQLRPQPKTSQTIDGFTMIELLIGTIMAFLIITPLLGFVVSVLNDDVREQAKSTTDFEQQAAISFISEDLGQAYFIYDAEEVEDGIDDLPNVDGTPVLVFWKQQTIPNALPPDITQNVPKDCDPDGLECNNTSVTALVAYYLVQDDEEIWCQPQGDECPQRIVRYVMKQDIEKYRGTGVGFDEGDLKDSQKGNVIFDSEFSFDEPTQGLIESYTREVRGDVLINYVADFTVDNVVVTNDAAKITIKSDGKRRIDSGQSCELDEVKALCPKATVTVKGVARELN